MSEPTGDKPFKTLKLTSLKSAKGKPVEGVESAPVVPAGAPVEAVPAVDAPAVQATPEVSETKAPEMRMPPPVAKTGGSLNMMSLKIGASKASGADSPGAATTPAPKLSPGAASSGGTPKPFKVLSATPTGLGAVVPPAIPVARERDVIPDTRSVVGEASAAPPAIPAPVEKPRPVVKPAPVEERPVEAPSKRSRKPLFIAVGALVLVGVAAGGFFVLSAGSTTPKEEPVKRLVPEGPTDADPVPNPDAAGLKPEVLRSVVSVPADKGPVGAPKVRRTELDDWLQKTSISTVTSRRITMNERHFSFGDVVNSTGNLRWMGRDSQTRDLIFIDEDGVVYTRPSGGQK